MSNEKNIIGLNKVWNSNRMLPSWRLKKVIANCKWPIIGYIAKCFANVAALGLVCIPLYQRRAMPHTMGLVYT
jgi:hypothetical protein